MAAPSSSLVPAAVRSDVETEELLDRLLTRLALCDDPKLEPLLAKLLPLAISSLSTNSQQTRNKVLEILTHVNKRVKHQPGIGLPLSDLWKMLIEENTSPMVKNFCIVYIEMAFERVNLKEKETMGPMLVGNILKLPQQHREIIMRIAVKVIGECHARGIDEEVAEKYKLINKFQEWELFIDFFTDTMLYQPSPLGGGCPAGLSVSKANRVAGKSQLKGDMLLTRKLGILNLVEALELAPELVYPLYLVACADSQEPVVRKGEELLKRKASGAILEEPKLINRLFLLFNGTSNAENVALESRVSPANAALKVKLMAVFCRSVTAANSFPSTLQCIFGSIYGSGTTSRLKQLGMEFTVWVFKHARIEQLKLMGPVILNGILKLLDGYPSSESDSVARDTRTFSFQAIGLLAQRLPQLFSDKIDMAVRLFDALKVESQNLRFIIQEATNSLAAAYMGAPANVLKDLETLLVNNCQVDQDEVRFCVMSWATSLFDSEHCPSRFICMLGAADHKLDIREMAIEGIFLGKDDGRRVNENLKRRYPKLGNMLEYILKQQPQLLESSETRDQKLLFPFKVYVAMVKFLLGCFESELAEDDSLGGSPEFLSTAERLCLLLEHTMAIEGSVELHSSASKALVKVGSQLPEMAASHYASRISWLKQLLAHVDLDTRESAARLLGIASSALEDSMAYAIITELVSLVSSTNKLRFEAQHGALCGIGYVTAECVYRTPIPEEFFQNTLKCLIDVITSETATLAATAIEALGHIALRAPLPLVMNDSHSVGVLTVILEKLKKLLSGDDIKPIQKTVISLGHICARETSVDHMNIALDLIFSLCRSKVEDVLFAAGEALAFLWGGVPVTADMILKTNYSSLSMISNFLMDELSLSVSRYSASGKIEASEDSRVLIRETVARKLFDNLLYSSRKEERCAGTVWLLSLTMYCGNHPTIQQKLPEIQEAFSHLLGEQNELIQELASQGMSIVYELGDPSMKKSLVDALVSTLTGSGKRKRAIKLVEDSEVFQEGAIGDSMSGGKLSTYKELCNLANEMGQPDLIYKFMDLANYQASLNSKRGAAFGFSKIAKQAGDALQPHLRSLIPRLVRYQYDPEKNVQDAMVHIWRALIADPRRTIDENLDLIFDDLLMQCGSRLWRSREASCLALADIIQGRRFDQVGKHLKQVWVAAFRAMDDIKETVRNAGDKLCRAVVSLTIRLCDVSLTETSDASMTMDIVLPFLLSEGILSKVDIIRKASTGVVMKLAKGAGTALRPHLSDLVCCMLESLSSLEDQGLNYVEMHAANAGIQTEKLESLRISIAKGSPMWETLDLCINVVDSKSLDMLVPRLSQLVRSAVGLNTRVGVATFLSLLVQKVGADIKPHASVLLRVLFPAVKEERSNAGKRAFASALAIILKHASSSQAQKLIEDTVALQTGDRNALISSALLLKSFSSVASDIVGGYNTVILPVIFISRFEDDKNVSDLFEELWEESTSGERVTQQLYLGEIVSLICESIASSSWSSKRKSAQAISKLSEVLGDSLSPYHNVLLKSLINEIPGRLWEGKEALLHAIAALSKSCHKAISVDDPSSPAAVLSLVSSACKKKVKKYREAAFSCLEQVISSFGNPDFFKIAFPLLLEMCNLFSSSKKVAATLTNEATEADLNDVEVASIPFDKVMDCLTTCIRVGSAEDILGEKKNLMLFMSVALSPGPLWTVKISAFSSIKELCSRLSTIWNDSQESSLHSAAITFVQELFGSVIPRIIECINTIKIAQVHIAAAECLLEVIKLGTHISAPNGSFSGLKADLLSIQEVEKNGQAKSLLRKSIYLVESLEHGDDMCNESEVH